MDLTGRDMITWPVSRVFTDDPPLSLNALRRLPLTSHILQ